VKEVEPGEGLLTLEVAGRGTGPSASPPDGEDRRNGRPARRKDLPAGGDPPGRRVPPKERPGDGALQRRNDFGRLGYEGPCTPPGPPHRSFFRLYALGEPLDLPPVWTRRPRGER